MTSEFVVYHTDTPLGNTHELGNHIMIFNAAYSWCLDNSIPFAVDMNAHPLFRNMSLPNLQAPQGTCYTITHLTDICPNGLPFQLHQLEGSSDTNGANIMSYAHNIQRIKDALNVPDVSVDGCILHYRLFDEAPHCNLGLPYFMNALKHIKSSTVYIMYGSDNYAIKAEQTKRNVQYLIEHLSKIYPDKQFIDMQTVPEYKRDDPKDECALHWYLCVNAPELITSNSTFSFSAAIFRGDRRTIMSKHAKCYQNFNVNDYKKILKDVHLINRNIIISAWYEIPEIGGDRDIRRRSIKTFFDRVNNADIIIATNDDSIFKEISVDGLSHVWLINKPVEELYGYRFMDIWSTKYEEPHKDHPRFNAKRLAMWYSKLWLCNSISGLLKGSYDRLAWIDLAVFKSSEISDKMDVFPLFEKYALPRITMHCLSSIGSFMRDKLFYHGMEFSMVLFPSAAYVSRLYELFDIVITTCFRSGIYLSSDELYMTLVIDLVGDLFNVSLDRAIRWECEYGWHHWYFDYSETYDVFVNTIYNDITVRPPKIEMSHLRQFIAMIENATKK